MRKNVTTIVFFLFLSSFCQLLAQDQFFISGGYKIRYVTRGTGIPVILIHGMTQNIESCWMLPIEGGNLIERLSKNHQVIALDCRGHGKSDKPHDSAQYGMLMVKDVVNLLNYLHISKAHIVGFSMGAIIAGNFQLNYPDRVLSTVLSSALVDTKKENEEWGVQDAMKRTALDISNGRGLYSMIKWLELPQKNHPAMRDEQALGIGRFLMQNNDSVAIISVLKAFEQFDVNEKRLEGNKISTLVLMGTLDHSILAARRNIKHFKNARLKEISEKDHAGVLSSREYYNSVETFINQ